MHQGGRSPGVVDQKEQTHALVAQLAEHPVQLAATGQIQTLVGVFQDEKIHAPGDLLQQAEFAGLSGAELAVAPVEQIVEGKQLDQVAMAVDVGEKGPGRGAGIKPVQEIGVVLAQLGFKNRLLALEREQPEVGGQTENVGTEVGCFPGDHVAELLYARAVAPDQTPGLTRFRVKPINAQPRTNQAFNLHHHMLLCTTGFAADGGDHCSPTMGGAADCRKILLEAAKRQERLRPAPGQRKPTLAFAKTSKGSVKIPRTSVKQITQRRRCAAGSRRRRTATFPLPRRYFTLQ